MSDEGPTGPMEGGAAAGTQRAGLEMGDCRVAGGGCRTVVDRAFRERGPS
jgi:hypothetical protein